MRQRPQATLNGTETRSPFLDELDVSARFDHFTRDLVPEHHSDRRRGPAADHVLVGSAYVGRHHAQDDAVGDLASARGFELGVGNVLDFDLAGTGVDDAAVAHGTLLMIVWNRNGWGRPIDGPTAPA